MDSRSPMVQTVIRWRRASDLESLRQAEAPSPCSRLLGSALCYVISGTLLLLIGVIMTSVSFQNLEGNNNDNNERYMGPVLMGGGLLVMGRGALARLWPRQRTLVARRRSLLRRYVQEIYSRPILALENTSAFNLCDMETAELYHISTRTRLYRDEPPSYEAVTGDDSNIYHNPAFLLDDENASAVAVVSGNDAILGCEREVTIVVHPPSDTEPDPPPSYEEYIKSIHMKTTRL